MQFRMRLATVLLSFCWNSAIAERKGAISERNSAISASKGAANFDLQNVSFFDFYNSHQEVDDKQSNEIPENVIEMTEDEFSNLDLATDLDSLLDIMGIAKPVQVIQTPNVFSDLLSARNAAITFTRSADQPHYISNPEQAGCNPEIKSVDLGFSRSTEAKYFPTCLRIKRCGGCCPNESMLECQPVASEKVFVKVLELKSQNTIPNVGRIRRERANRLRVSYDAFNVTVEEHTMCSCLCKLKESDCDLGIHHYDSVSCSCDCKNKDDEAKCFSKNSHVWDSKQCQCLCRNMETCSSGEEFDHNYCSCRRLSKGISIDDLFISRRFSNRWRRPMAVPLDEPPSANQLKEEEYRESWPLNLINNYSAYYN